MFNSIYLISKNCYLHHKIYNIKKKKLFSDKFRYLPTYNYFKKKSNHFYIIYNLQVK